MIRTHEPWICSLRTSTSPAAVVGLWDAGFKWNFLMVLMNPRVTVCPYDSEMAETENSHISRSQHFIIHAVFLFYLSLKHNFTVCASLCFTHICTSVRNKSKWDKKKNDIHSVNGAPWSSVQRWRLFSTNYCKTWNKCLHIVFCLCNNFLKCGIE